MQTNYRYRGKWNIHDRDYNQSSAANFIGILAFTDKIIVNCIYLRKLVIIGDHRKNKSFQKKKERKKESANALKIVHEYTLKYHLYQWIM